MRKPASRAILIAAVVIGMLGGCAARDAEPTPPPVAEAPTPTPTPTPEPTRPAVADLVLTTKGLDYLVVGSPIEERDDAWAIVRWAEDLCDADNGAKRSAWAPNYPEGDDAFYLFTHYGERDGFVRRIVVASPEIATPEGIHRGSSEADVLAAYPDAVVLTDNPSINRYIVAGTAGKLVIEVGSDSEDNEYEKGVVVFLSSSSLEDGTWGIANTGAGGTCGD